MTLVKISPDSLAMAAADISCLTSTLDNAHRKLRGPTIEIEAAGSDEISRAITGEFSRFAADHHAQVDRAEATLCGIVANLTDNAQAYKTAETSNTASLSNSASMSSNPAPLQATPDFGQLTTEFIQRLMAPPINLAEELVATANMAIHAVASFGLIWWVMLNFATFAIQNLLTHNILAALFALT